MGPRALRLWPLSQHMLDGDTGFKLLPQVPHRQSQRDQVLYKSHSHPYPHTHTIHTKQRVPPCPCGPSLGSTTASLQEGFGSFTECACVHGYRMFWVLIAQKGLEGQEWGKSGISRAQETSGLAGGMQVPQHHQPLQGSTQEMGPRSRRPQVMLKCRLSMG